MIKQILHMYGHITIHVLPDDQITPDFLNGSSSIDDKFIVSIGVGELIMKDMAFFQQHDVEFMLGLVEYPVLTNIASPFANKWSPQFIMQRNGIFLLVSREGRRCRNCEHLLQVATFARSDLYMGVPNWQEVIKEIDELVPAIGCPVCNSRIERGIVWAVKSE